MKSNIIILSISLIMFTFWSIRVYYKVFEKNIKKYVLGIGILLIFWVNIRIIKIFVRSNFMWYLYYVALIFMPTFYYLCSKYLLNKNKKINICIIFFISTFLLIMVLTNDIHTFVFKFDYKDYRNYIGYFIIVIWIMYLLLGATINILKRAKSKGMKIIIPFVPIIIGLIYTVFYVLNIPGFIREINMTIVIGWLFVFGIESIFYMELIPNNIKYGEVFKNSYLPICIISKNGKIVYQTSNSFIVPNVILEDIKKQDIKEKYINPSNKNQVYEIGILKNCYSIIKKDYSKIIELKDELQEKNEKLIKQEKSLIRQKEIKDKLYEIQMNNEILEKVEEKIKEKRNKIEIIMNNMEKFNTNELENVRYLIAYCKRMSNLIVSNYNNEIFNSEKMEVMFNELLEDSKSRGIYGFINIDNIILKSSTITEIYEIMFSIFQNIKNIGVLVKIDKENIKVVFDNKINSIKNLLEKNDGINFKEIYEKNNEDGTEIIIKLNV